jgi:hypothetical protein
MNNELWKAISENVLFVLQFFGIVIAMFINYEKPDETFKNWAWGNKVYNIYYANDEGEFDFT